MNGRYATWTMAGHHEPTPLTSNRATTDVHYGGYKSNQHPSSHRDRSLLDTGFNPWNRFRQHPSSRSDRSLVLYHEKLFQIVYRLVKVIGRYATTLFMILHARVKTRAYV